MTASGQFTQGVFSNLVMLTNQETGLRSHQKIASNAKIKPVVMFFEELHRDYWANAKKSLRTRLNRFKQKAPNQSSRLFVLRRCTVIDSSACTVV